MKSEIQSREITPSPEITVPIKPIPMENLKIEEISLDKDNNEPETDEKQKLMDLIKKELPKLPKKKIKYIITELMKRPEGKLRDTWLKVYVHKNQQYK